MGVSDNDVQAYVWVYPRNFYPSPSSVCVRECITEKQWLMFARPSFLRWSAPEAFEGAQHFSSLCVQALGEAAETPHGRFVCARQHELCDAHSLVCSESIYLRVPWGQLAVHYLTRKIHGRWPMKALGQQMQKLVIQHYSLCVNMEILWCGGNAPGRWCWYSHGDDITTLLGVDVIL